MFSKENTNRNRRRMSIVGNKHHCTYKHQRETVGGNPSHTHAGMVHMKAMARIHIWWPGIDADIESTVKACGTGQSMSHDPPQVLVHHWAWPYKELAKDSCRFRRSIYGRDRIGGSGC